MGKTFTAGHNCSSSETGTPCSKMTIGEIFQTERLFERNPCSKMKLKGYLKERKGASYESGSSICCDLESLMWLGRLEWSGLTCCTRCSLPFAIELRLMWSSWNKRLLDWKVGFSGVSEKVDGWEREHTWLSHSWTRWRKENKNCRHTFWLFVIIIVFAIN